MKELDRIINKNFLLFKELLDKAFKTLCPKCKNGSIKHIGSQFTGRTWIELYECDNCKTLFI